MSKNNTHEIVIKCKGAGTLSLSQMNPLQGAFKVLTEENRKKFCYELMTDGFIEPISVWEDPESSKTYILNGHQRYAALSWLKENGWRDEDGKKIDVVVPQVPITIIYADTLLEAKRKILALASQYGSVSSQGLKSLLQELNIPAEELSKQFNFPEVDMSSILSGLTVPVVIGQALEMNPLLREHHGPPPTPKEIVNTSKELDLNSFDNFDHQCPKCGFEFNGNT